MSTLTAAPFLFDGIMWIICLDVLSLPQIIIPQKQVGRNSDIYVTMVSYTTQVSSHLTKKDCLLKHWLPYSFSLSPPGGQQGLVCGDGGDHRGDGEPRGRDPAWAQPAWAHQAEVLASQFCLLFPFKNILGFLHFALAHQAEVLKSLCLICLLTSFTLESNQIN